MVYGRARGWSLDVEPTPWGSGIGRRSLFGLQSVAVGTAMLASGAEIQRTLTGRGEPIWDHLGFHDWRAEMRFTVASLAITAALTMGCSGVAYRMASVPVDTSQYVVVGEGEMSATGLQLFSIIPIQNTNKLQRAVDRILEDNNGDELINISVTESWWWAYILNGYKVDVSGTVLKKK